jgi:hypothetical protein
MAMQEKIFGYYMYSHSIELMDEDLVVAQRYLESEVILSMQRFLQEVESVEVPLPEFDSSQGGILFSFPGLPVLIK